jgi:Na+-transporting methylmalonyl-CoA/oxaloacetate decarboxylase gamma subunit
MFKKMIVVFLTLTFLIVAIGSVSAATYKFSNSTDADSIEKMVSGEAPIKNNKFIKNGDIIKFKSGNYHDLNLVVKKSITITKTKKKAKVTFIGNNTGTAIKLTNKNKKVNINGIKIQNYEYGIYGKANSATISKMNFYKNSNKGINIKGNKLKISNNKFVGNEASIHIFGKNNIISSNKINKGGWYNDVIFIKGTNNLITRNKIKAPDATGIAVEGNKNNISKNIINKCVQGIFGKGDKNLISYNKVYNMSDEYSGEGITIYGGKRSTIVYNTIKSSTLGLGVFGEKTTVSFNKIYNNKVGIEYYKGNSISKNIFKNNKKNLKKVVKELGPEDYV